ncbi:protection of telomeres protein 1b [Sesbania bispinosa]|nr:protection of telomeres protein 1b [Sesbania bispinosa]
MGHQKSEPHVSYGKKISIITPKQFTLSPLEQFCTSRNGRKGSAFLLPIIERERLSNERKISESGKIPCRIPVSSLFSTEVNNEDPQYGTLMDIYTHSEVAAKFKCVVRVVAASPYSAEDLWSPDGTYRMRLTLEDSTSRLHAFIVAEDGVKP